MQLVVVYNINLFVGWEVIEGFGLVLCQYFCLFVLLFCDDYDFNGVFVGYVRCYLWSCYVYLICVFCDNIVYFEIWVWDFGVDCYFFEVVKFFYECYIDEKCGLFVLLELG